VPIEGYEKPLCYLTRPAAAALAQVVRDLEARGLTLKVFDCYRPERAVAQFRALGAEPQRCEDEGRVLSAGRQEHAVSGRLYRRALGHSRRSTMDLTLSSRADGKDIDMGTPFDFFSPRSWPSDRP